MELSKRLKAVATMVARGSIVADVGCDHGYVSIYLVHSGICPRVIAMDINQGPLEKAKQHILEYGLSQYIETRRSDGINALERGEADTLIAAGMGGRLVIKILEEQSSKIRVMKELILQPQSDILQVRRFLRKNHYDIIEEKMILEDGKFYPMMKALINCESEKEEDKNQEIYDRFGKLLLKEKNSCLFQFLQKEKNMYEVIKDSLQKKPAKTEKQNSRLKELEWELECIRKALAFFEGGK